MGRDAHHDAHHDDDHDHEKDQGRSEAFPVAPTIIMVIPTVALGGSQPHC